MKNKLKIFIAGASGYTGQRLVPLLENHIVAVHLRKESKNFTEKKHHFETLGVTVVTEDLQDQKALARIVSDFDWMISLVGTTRAQFDKNTSYESVDFGVNKTLFEIADKAHVKKFLLVSSVGADKPTGPYLKIKKKTDDALISSGLDYVIVRPSMLVGNGRNLPILLNPFFSVLGTVSSALANKYRPIDAKQLAKIMTRILEEEALHKVILEGSELWAYT